MRRMWPLLVLAAAAGAPWQGSAPPMPDTDAPAPGISLELAGDRARRIRDLRYELHFTVPEHHQEPLQGRVVVRFDLIDPSRALALDFGSAGRVRSASIGGRAVDLRGTPGHLVVPAGALRQGQNEIAVEFLAGDASLNRDPEFLYTLFVPARAHLAFPCFDQPDLKARWTLSLDIPRGWEALANGVEVDRRPSAGSGQAARVQVRFAETGPLPTYLFAFAAGRFQVETSERAGRVFRMLHRETDAAKVDRNRGQIFDLHASALAWLERYTGIPYPWGKFDFLLVPSFQFGGMEHAGAVFYNASALLLDPSATQNQKLGRASLIAHETAHMWFGDLVTMRWFDDVWLKEVFANFMAAKIVNPAFPEIHHDLRFLYAHYPAAYEIDRTPGSNAIRQRLDNLTDAGTLYGAIIYQKAPIVMRQLEAMLGPEPMQQGLRAYLKQYAFGTATWPDLIALLDERTPEDLGAWSAAWVQEAGRPVISTELEIVDGRIARLALAQRDPVAARGLVWSQRLQIAIGLPDGARVVSVRLAEPQVEIAEARGLPAPDYVLPTAGGLGYGGFVLDPRTIEYLLARLPDIEDPLTRGAAWVTLWDQMLEGRAAAGSLIDLALQALPAESDEQNIQRILGYAREAYWRFVGPGDRRTLAPRLEAAFRAGLDAAPTPSLKSAWFSALRDVALTPEALGWMERVWRKQTQVAGLELAEPDYVALALELAVREVAAWEEILALQQQRIENPDRRARFAFVRPALSPDRAVRDALFRSLGDSKNRRRERWVLDALEYLHHPLRAAESQAYIRPSLDLLAEIQRTGDIFFPKRWTDATLRGHSSAAAARTVREFLRSLPSDYPDRLRRIVLSSSDDLFRASGVER